MAECDLQESDEAMPGGLFAVTAWDAVPATLGLVHFAFVVLVVGIAPSLDWPAFLALGFLYACGIAWSIHSVSHNLIHNPFFRSDVLNRAFSVMVSLTLSYPQGLIRHVHLRHHIGNMDRPNAKGETRDLISIYRYGRDGQPEGVWAYGLLTLFRSRPFQLRASVAQANALEGRWAAIELTLIGLSLVLASLWDWRVVPILAPFWLLGHMLSNVTGYYEHLGADPKRPLVWGVSSYGRLYNWLFLNNGYHAEHHYRTKVHWTGMKALHEQIAQQQRDAGTKTLVWPHPLGFLG